MKLKALVVDDSLMDQKIIHQVLKTYDAKVEFAPDGIEASQKLIKKQYDLIFLDIQMPEITGVQFLLSFQGSLLMRHTEIVVVTGRTDQEIQTVCKNLGVKYIIQKPIHRFNKLQTIIDAILAEKINTENKENSHGTLRTDCR